MNVPTFPMAGLLVFWGGIENGYWSFSFKPSEYAKNVNCPTLVRDRNKFNIEKYRTLALSEIEVDFLKRETLTKIPVDIPVN